MKKLALFVAAALVSAASMAQTINNPVGEDGRYIVKWDCAKGEFAASNDFEPGETFTFAVDITGTAFEEALKTSPIEGATRCMAANIWTNYGPKKDATNRLVQIKGNIYGATYNFKQLITDNDKAAGEKIKNDSIVYAYCQLFMFAYGMKDGKMDEGLEWYVDAVPVQAPGSDCLFATLPSTGNDDAKFYTDDFTPGIFSFSEVGYAAPCAGQGTGIEEVKEESTTRKVVENGQLILIKDGVRYNVLGSVVK